MDDQKNAGISRLTPAQKQVLRMWPRMQAKEIAASLGLSHHAINERLRDARRILDVNTSGEASRLLLESEQALSEIEYKRLVPKPDYVADAAYFKEADRVGKVKPPLGVRLPGKGERNRLGPVQRLLVIILIAIGIVFVTAGLISIAQGTARIADWLGDRV
jgi:DNA-binding CsgD family transcriptional regulator